MKLNIYTPVLMTFGIASAIALSAESSQAQERFSCDLTQVSTMVETERGLIPFLRWTDRSFPPPYTPQQRCQIVSERFRKFDRNSMLKYIKADTINNLPVLCVAAYRGGSCLPDGLLVTFKPGTNADAALIKILDRRVWATGEPYRLNSDNINKPERVISQFDGKTYVNMALFLDLTSQKQ